MDKITKLSKELKTNSNFVKGYLGDEDFWIIVDNIEKAIHTQEFHSLVKKYFNDKNILILDKTDEKELLEELGSDKKNFKIVYK